MKVGLFFGSFNPVHVGHLIIANYVVESTDLDQIWFVVSPQNPFKQRSNLLDEYDRLQLVELACEDNDRLFPSNIEFGLPKPSYTSDTLAYLYDRFPSYRFSLLMGSDNLKSLHKWKNFEVILNNQEVIVYKRSGAATSRFDDHPNVNILEGVPQLNISSTFIRKLIKEGKSIRYIVPDKAAQYIEEMNLYR